LIKNGFFLQILGLAFLMKILLLILFINSSLAITREVSLSEKVTFNTGDVITLKGTDYSISVSDPYEPVKCAIPGRNCGKGYRPPVPTFDVKCSESPCPYILQNFNQSGTSGTLSIETEETCVSKGHQADNCFYVYARSLKTDDGCMTLKTALGKFYCLKKFDNSARTENKGLCDQLPKDISGLQWGCFYDYAILYRDPSFCAKFDKTDVEIADRCWKKMAEVMKDKTLCRKISITKNHTYKEQCDQLSFK
jgi:hypothetical protein